MNGEILLSFTKIKTGKETRILRSIHLFPGNVLSSISRLTKPEEPGIRKQRVNLWYVCRYAGEGLGNQTVFSTQKVPLP